MPPRKRPLERTVEETLARETKRRRILAPKLTPVGRRGWPDRLLLAHPGIAGFCELKRPGERPRPLQRVIHRLLRRLGFEVLVLDDAARIGPALDDWLTRARANRQPRA